MMGAPEKLDGTAVGRGLDRLPGWALREGKLFREYKFKNFVQAFAFMSAAALEAEKLNHHPDWFNSWNLVRVELCTHSAGGLTDLDFKLAGRMDELAGSLPG